MYIQATVIDRTHSESAWWFWSIVYKFLSTESVYQSILQRDIRLLSVVLLHALLRLDVIWHHTCDWHNFGRYLC